LLIEEFGPKLTYVKGVNNIVADALSRMRMTENDFSKDAFAAGDEDLPANFPLSYREIQNKQTADADLQQKLTDNPEEYSRKSYAHSSGSYELIVRNDKIVIPASMQRKATEWYHSHLLHPGETRMELTLGQHFCWTGMRNTVKQVCRACNVCKAAKHGAKKYGLLPPKNPEVIPWHTLCIDLIGPYKIGKGDSEITLHCLTMIDPATGWFEIVEIPNKQADEVINYLEFTWLTRYPWPTEVIMDRGKEFAAEVRDTLKDEYGIIKKLITTRNPQANAMVERAHQIIHNMIRSMQIRSKEDIADYGWQGVLAAVRQAMRSTVHTTTRATPTQLVFGRDAILNVSFEADWQYIKERKQNRILQNNAKENASRIIHEYSIGDRVMVNRQPNRKHGSDKNIGPFTVTRVNDNGTLRLTKVTANGGAVSQTWNVRNVNPCKD
jgi:transposase InsO family protein